MKIGDKILCKNDCTLHDKKVLYTFKESKFYTVSKVWNCGGTKSVNFAENIFKCSFQILSKKLENYPYMIYNDYFYSLEETNSIVRKMKLEKIKNFFN